MSAAADDIGNAAFALEFASVDFSYATQPVLSGFSLGIPPGSVVCLIGRNGTGKSTALRIGYRLLQPVSGNVRVFGRLWSAWNERALKRRMGYLPQRDSLFDGLTVEENLEGIARLFGVPVDGSFRAHCQERFTLGQFWKKRFASLSEGQKRMACLAAATLHEPEMLLLDEPFESLDAQRQDVAAQLIAEGVRRGGTVVVATHALRPLEHLSPVVVTMEGARRDASARVASQP